MAEREGTLKSSMEAPRWAGLKQLLYDMEIRHHCDLTILDHDKGLLRELIRYKFAGKESNLMNLKRDLERSFEEYNKDPFISGKYNVKEAKFEISSRDTTPASFNATLKVGKWSSVKELVENASEYLSIRTQFDEQNNGFLKGKTVTISAFSYDQKKMMELRKLFEGHIVSAKPIIITTKNNNI